MGNTTKAWLAIMGVLAVIGTGLVIYFHQMGDVALAKDVLHGGGNALFGMVLFLGVAKLFGWED